MQLELQPSPLITLPSSQPKADVRLPSPQSSEQIEGDPEVQVYPDSTIHVDDQPSPLSVFPSSQLPEPPTEFIPSPQTITHMSGELEEPPRHV